jgi:predicted transposase YdaD
MSNEEIDKFKTNLREVMLFIKYSKDKNKLNELLTGDEKFKSMDRNAAEVINTVTGSGLKLKDKEDTIDMCKAIEDMMNDSRSAGRSEGHSEGLAEGRNQGRSEGLVEGRNQGRSEGLVEANINTALRMLEKGKYSIDEIAELVELPIEKVRELSNHKAV